MGHFCPPGSGFGLRIRIRGPDWIWIQSGSATLLTMHKEYRDSGPFWKRRNYGFQVTHNAQWFFKPWKCTTKGLWPAKGKNLKNLLTTPWRIWELEKITVRCLVEPGLRTSHWECSAWPRLRPTRSSLASSSNTASYRLNPRKKKINERLSTYQSY